jgi:phospholipid transport system substrate-binding protein
MNLRTCTFSLALITLLALAPSRARAGEAANAFKAKHDTIVELVNKNASDATLGNVIDDMLDYRALAEASLGGPNNYAKVCADRCAEFEALLTKLIRTNYLRMARQINAHPLQHLDDVEGRNGVHKVTTKVKVEKNGRQRNMTIEYVMHQVDGRWQVRDIITDDISLVANYRSDFHKIAKSEGIDGIIKRLADKLAGS